MTILTQIKYMIDISNVSKLARDTGVSRAQLDRIADGLTLDPGLVTIEKIVNTLGYDLSLTKRQVCQSDDTKPARKETED